MSAFLRETHHVGAVARKQADADAAARLQELALELERLAQHGEQLGRDIGSGGRSLQVAQHHGEFVAAEPGDRVGIPQHPGQPLAHCPQQRIARVVAEPVVDLLEVIEIEHQEGTQVAWSATVGEIALQPLEQHPTVGEPGEAIALGEHPDPLLRRFHRGQVLNQREPALLGRMQHDAIEQHRHAAPVGTDELLLDRDHGPRHRPATPLLDRAPPLIVGQLPPIEHT
ncbi:MAG: hypothetical protein R3C69_18415 [Geminicoccaceae bacterium]